MSRRFILSAVVYGMVNAILFGFGAIVVLSFYEPYAATLLPIVVVASFVLAVPLAWYIGPRMSTKLSNQLGLAGQPGQSSTEKR